MNKFLVFIVLAVVITACASTKQPLAAGDRNGASYETAIVAKSVASEYEWLRAT